MQNAWQRAWPSAGSWQGAGGGLAVGFRVEVVAEAAPWRRM